MDIKCINNPYYISTSSAFYPTHFQGSRNAIRMAKSVKKVVSLESGAKLREKEMSIRPVASKNATGLIDYINKLKISIINYLKNYKNNIKHTIDHKMIFALVEKEIYGKRSIDSLTHDLDKLIMYIFGIPKSTVTKIHRHISEHHIESNKKLNLKSMLCDHIASSPEFKPEKKLGLRDFYSQNIELQNIDGYKEVLEKYNYGESLDFNKIKFKQEYQKNYLPHKAHQLTKKFATFII